MAGGRGCPRTSVVTPARWRIWPDWASPRSTAAAPRAVTPATWTWWTGGERWCRPRRAVAGCRAPGHPGPRLSAGQPTADVLARGRSAGQPGARPATAYDPQPDARLPRRRPDAGLRYAGRRPAGPMA